MKSALSLFILLTIFILTDCEKSGTEQIKVETGVPAYIRTSTVYNVTNSVSFKIDSIHDSRCPQKVECFWAGYAGLYFNINNNGTHIDTLIYFGMPVNNPFFIGNYKWEVLDVEPHSEYGELIDQEDYQVKFKIEKR